MLLNELDALASVHAEAITGLVGGVPLFVNLFLVFKFLPGG